MKLCEYIDKCLKEIGVDKIFGVPGSLVMPIWQSISSAEVILCSHEQEASYVATGYAKATKKPVAVITTGGPGVTNCISGIASANIDSVPLIYISGRTPFYKNGLGVKQEESHYNRMYDSVDVLCNFTKKSVCITDVMNASEQIRNTMKEAIQNRFGAVHISIPVDIQNKEIKEIYELKKVTTITKHPNTTNDISKLVLSNRPLFILGWGSWMSNSYLDVYELANKVNAPVLVTSKAYCCIDNDNPFYVGKLGYGYNSIIDDFISWYNPDSVIAFGSNLGEKDISESILSEIVKNIKTYVVTNDYFEKNNCSIRLIKVSNLKEFVHNLTRSVTKRDDDVSVIKKIQEERYKTISFWKNKIEKNDNMAKAIYFLSEKCDKNTVVTADAGNHLLNVGSLFEPKSCCGLFLDVGLRAMGTGICTAVGMAIADSNKRYIAITGDGCMLMNGNVMHLAKERNLPIVFVVFNNNSLGRVRVGQSIMNDYRATDILHVDFQSYANTFGLDTYRFCSILDFEKKIESIIRNNRTSLVEIVTDHNEIPVSIKGNIS